MSGQPSLGEERWIEDAFAYFKTGETDNIMAYNPVTDITTALRFSTFNHEPTFSLVSQPGHHIPGKDQPVNLDAFYPGQAMIEGGYNGNFNNRFELSYVLNASRTADGAVVLEIHHKHYKNRWQKTELEPQYYNLITADANIGSMESPQPANANDNWLIRRYY